jgi:hypothetical protein
MKEISEFAELDRLQRAIRLHPLRAGNTGAGFYETDFDHRLSSKEGHPKDAPLRLAIRQWRTLGDVAPAARSTPPGASVVCIRRRLLYG